MGRRWSQKEEEALAEVKRRLKDQLANRPQFPEVVGDRRIMRFLRGKALNVDESTKMIKAFLKWRDDNKVDDVRQDIVYGGKDSPFKFPFGKTIIDIAPQIVQSAVAMDRKGRPLAMEMFDFSPKEVLDAISIADYLVFLTYSLEYRALILEQMSHEREQAYLAEHPDHEDRKDGYGVVILDYTIRDLKGVGFGHLGSKGRALVGAALELGLPNYQEYLGKCVMVNTPWVFNTFWYFVKGFLDEETIAKINLVGSNYMPTLLEDLTFENIPEKLGGGFKQYNEPYEFDASLGGPLYCEPYHVHTHHHGQNNRRGSKNRPSLTIDTSARSSSTPSSGSAASSPAATTLTRPTPANQPGAYTSWPETPQKTPSTGSLSISPATSVSQQSQQGYSAGRDSVGGSASRTAATLLYPRVQRSGRLSIISTKSPYPAPRNPQNVATSPVPSSPPFASLGAHLEAEPGPGPGNYSQKSPQQRPSVTHEDSTVSSLSSTTDNTVEASSKQPFAGEAGTSARPGIAERPSSKATTESSSKNSKTHSTKVEACMAKKQNWLIVSLVMAIVDEWHEFLSSLYEVLTRYPLKTITATSIIVMFCYLRWLGKLHLLVFPVLFLATLTYFELFR